MAYQDKVENVRANIFAAVQAYKDYLVGKYYLYIFENNYFEMYYGTENFMHLTGVASNLSPNQFYELAKNKTLQNSQIYFNDRYPLRTALKKTKNLANLKNFVNSGYFVVRDLETESEIYPYTITDIDRSVLIALKEEEIEHEIYIPKSFRVKGNIFGKADNDKMHEINFILSKNDDAGLYNTILYQEKEFSTLPEEILIMIDKNIIENANNNAQDIALQD